MRGGGSVRNNAGLGHRTAGLGRKTDRLGPAIGRLNRRMVAVQHPAKIDYLAAARPHNLGAATAVRSDHATAVSSVEDPAVPDWPTADHASDSAGASPRQAGRRDMEIVQLTRL